MKLLLFLSFISTLLVSNSTCESENKPTGKHLKGKLEIAGICMNYTIRVIEGDPGKDAVDSIWTNEATRKTYTRVFRLGNPCAFPSSINEGDEFYFRIDSSKQKDCIVCMAYYPTPTKTLNIKVVEP